MSIQFKFDGDVRDALTWEDLDILESGQIGKSRNILARFVVDEKGAPVPEEAARKQLGALKMSQIEGVMQSFMKIMQAEALPPPTAASSLPPSIQDGE